MNKLKSVESRTARILRQLKMRNEPVVLFGASLCGHQYLEILRKNDVEVLCFVDDDEGKQSKGIGGLPVFPVQQVAGMRGQIVISSYGPDRLESRLLNMDGSLASRIVKPDFYLWEDGLDYMAYYTEHWTEIEAADALLADEKSRQVFKNLLQYKISREPILIEDIREDVARQYFDVDLIRFSSEEVFLDLGAYNGDTVEAFAKRVQERYAGIIALEPDTGNFVKLFERTKDWHDVICYPCGVGAENGTAYFNGTENWTSSVAETGETQIEIRSVDSLLEGGRVTFLKADIEGSEKQMLLGARKTIEEQMPQMAVAVYHCKEDIFAIINTIESFCHGYQFYLRHYAEMPIETVLYALR